MPTATHVLTGNFDALVGEVGTIRATIRTNSSDGAWVDDTDDRIRLGGAVLDTGSTSGAFSVTLPTSTGTGLQYEVTAEYVNAERTRATWRSGWFELTADANLADKANASSLRVSASLGDQLAERIDGYTDHGDVSGDVTFNGPTGSHWFDATAPTTITLAGFGEGQIVSLLPFTGAADVTINGLPDLELADGFIASAQLARGVWVTGGGSGTPATPDSTPPTAVTGLDATGGAGQISASWTAATDAETSVSYRWRVWLTSGGATGAWTTTSSTSFTKTGLTVAGGYTVEVYAYSNGGASATATDTATVTVNPFPTADAYDTFTRSGNLWASTTEGGALTWGSTGVTGLIGGTGNPAIVANKSTDGGATVDVGRTTATIECDYVLNTGRASLMLGGANDGSSSVMARVFSAGELKVFHPGGGGTQIGSTVTGIAMTGHFTLSYDATTGAIDVKIDGVTKFTGTHTGLTGTRSGIECNNDATIDNVVWTWA